MIFTKSLGLDVLISVEGIVCQEDLLSFLSYCMEWYSKQSIWFCFCNYYMTMTISTKLTMPLCQQFAGSILLLMSPLIFICGLWKIIKVSIWMKTWKWFESVGLIILIFLANEMEGEEENSSRDLQCIILEDVISLCREEALSARRMQGIKSEFPCPAATLVLVLIFATYVSLTRPQVSRQSRRLFSLVNKLKSLDVTLVAQDYINMAMSHMLLYGLDAAKTGDTNKNAEQWRTDTLLWSSQNNDQEVGRALTLPSIWSLNLTTHPSPSNPSCEAAIS